uniref:DUF4781 domain-containing protein n=1 Tax=Anopheles atroparvus TaxID=41427 RepID=A0AAG5CYW9_ANOAO
MAEQNISKLMTEYLYREIITEKETQSLVANRFIQAKTKTEVVNLIGFALGYVQNEEPDLRKFERDDLFEPKVRKQLLAIVERMPSLDFMFLPLVLVRETDGVSIMPLLCVRKALQTVYLDMSLRLYDTFPEFLEENKLPPCQLWYPTDGLIRFNANGKLLLSCCTIKKRYTGVLKGIAVAGNIAATGLVLSPIAPVAAPIILLACNVPLIGFSIADLVDGCKYERGTVVAGRSAALVVNLVTFSTVGLTAACKAAGLRNLLSAEKLLLLEKAEMVMKVTARTVSSANAVYSIIGSVNGWQNLSGAEWVQVAANLCFAYHEVISVATATTLFLKLQKNGLVQFFLNSCPGVARALLEAKIDGWFGKMLDLVFGYLQSEAVEFTVDKDFTTIRLLGYELRFETLFQLNTDAMLSLLQYLRSYIAPIRKLGALAKGSFTHEVLVALMELLKLVGQLQYVSYKLDEYITIGRGFRFSFGTLLDWWNAPAHDRISLLKAIASLNDSKTEQLNEIRSTRLGAGGDAALFCWLAQTGNRHQSALRFLLETAALTGKQPIVFDRKHIVISSLLSLSVEEWKIIHSYQQCLSNTRFLQICKDAEDQQKSRSEVRLLERAKSAWIRTCNDPTYHTQLETVSLLKKLFSHSNISPPLTLGEALDYALSFEDATVGKVYYTILFAWRVLVQEQRSTFDRAAMMARFYELMDDASKLQMNRCMILNHQNQETDHNKALINIARGATRCIHYGENCKQMEELYFDSKEKGACWLHLLPALRHKEGRDQFNSTLRYLLKKGDAKVLVNEDGGDGEGNRAQHVMFYRGKMMVVLEMFHLPCGKWSASIHLCSLSFRNRALKTD